MDMEIVEEVMGSNDHGHIVKGKRTKRLRPSSPVSVAMTCSSSSGVGGGGDQSSPSPTTSVEFSENTEEEEDMANCLILLAQGHNKDDSSKRIDQESDGRERFINSRKFTEAITTTNNGKAGFYVYECKTCNRCFPSFQALGGHRASHKKPKAMVAEEKKKVLLALSEDEIQFNNNISPPVSLPFQMGINRALYGNPNPNINNNNNKSKVHECSICGSEFSSGQALGGHMRRHRAPTATTTTTTTTQIPIMSESLESKKPRNVLALDLNLPAPEEDRETAKFSFASSKQQPLVFSASALVDCHY